MNIDLKELTLESLFADGLPKAKAKPKAKPTPAPAPTPRPSPWAAEAVIWLIHAQTCTHCGHIFQSPGAQTPLVRFRHTRRPDEIWEVANHPSTLHPGLPQETRTLESTVQACFRCQYVGRDAPPPAIFFPVGPQQADLFLEEPA